MPDFQHLQCWIRQAEADLIAAEAAVSEVRENHRRYWLQQSYEKAIKAWGMLRYDPAGPAEQHEFLQHFLSRHGPFASRSAADIPRRLFLLRRQLLAFLNDRLADHTNALTQVDGTIPQLDPGAISYRYPFVPPDSGEYISPSDYDGWDQYQCNWIRAQTAVTQ